MPDGAKNFGGDLLYAKPFQWFSHDIIKTQTRIGLLSTLKRRFRCPKTELFEHALQSG